MAKGIDKAAEPPASDKLAIYEGRVGLDLMAGLASDTRLRPMKIKGRIYLSLVSLMEVFGDSNYNPRQTWVDEKKRLRKRAPQLSENFLQLKLPAADGKRRLTDVASLETCFKVLLYMETPSSDRFKEWAAGVLARVTEAELAYRATNIAAGMEWAADEIHEAMKELSPDTDPDDPIYR